MKMFLLSDSRETLVGMRLAGVEGKLIKDTAEFPPAWRDVISDKDVAVLLISEGLASEFEEIISNLKLSGQRPLVVSLPDMSVSKKDSSFISRHIQEAIGVKI